MELIKVNGVTLSDEEGLEPSGVSTGFEILRNTERGLDGKMSIDVVAQKKSYEVLYSVVDDATFKRLNNIFSKFSEVAVEFLDEREQTEKYYVESITYTPVFLSGTIHWQDYTAKIVEI